MTLRLVLLVYTTPHDWPHAEPAHGIELSARSSEDWERIVAHAANWLRSVGREEFETITFVREREVGR
jgi:hypothetical protein